MIKFTSIVRIEVADVCDGGGRPSAEKKEKDFVRQELARVLRRELLINGRPKCQKHHQNDCKTAEKAMTARLEPKRVKGKASC